MSDETILDPGNARSGGRKIVDAVQAAQGTVPGLMTQIQTACASTPWGDDEAGRACDRQFSAIPATLDGLKTTLAKLLLMGQNIEIGVTRTVDTDTEARDRITAAGITNGRRL